MATFDPHSFADDLEPRIQKMQLSFRVDFERRVLDASATLVLERAAEGRLTLDSRGLTVHEVVDAEGRRPRFFIEREDPVRGQALVIELESKEVTLRYTTSPDATALGWLAPAQTAGGRQPFVYTQCQAIHARTIIPCQDTPRIRTTFRATIEVPEPLVAVMAARAAGSEAAGAGRTRYHFEMPQPIPSYLIAFAAGDLVARDVGPRSRIWAEPAVADGAAWEFAGIDSMLTAAEALFGPYDWERFDVLVMPPSFPYGGMENPRLTFVTPTLISGDRSLVNVLAHELAHSWTGNLVTNATMEHFWLNEGFTTFAERRIIERLDGDKELSLQVAIGRRGLEADLRRFGETSPVTKLRTHLEGTDPDQVYSRIPYEKGYLFLRRIEEVIGRAAFDRFLKAYIAKFRFRSITTEEFLAFLGQAAPEVAGAIDLGIWIDGPGIPADAPVARSEALDAVEAVAASAGRLPDPKVAAAWSPSEWQVYLSALPRVLDPPVLAALEAQHQLATAKNAEIRLGFLLLAARAGWKPAFAAIERALADVGRMKFLRPMYVALLAAGGEARALAVRAFAENRGRYHPVAAGVLEPLLSAPQDSREEPVL